MSNSSGAKVDYQDFSNDSTDFIAKLKRVLADINIRVAAVENIKGMVDEFERRYGEVALHRIEQAIAPVLQTMLDGLEETRAALAALDEDYRTNGQQRVDSIINPLIAEAQAALAAATAQMHSLEQFLSLKQSVAEKGLANGYASLGADGKIPTSQLPASVLGAMAFQATWNANNNTPAIPAAAVANKGHYYKVAVAGTTNIGGITDWQVGDMVVSNGASWDKIDNTEQVMSVAGLMGAITALALKTALALVKADVGLGNVDNTSDANKPVSTALNLKSNTGHVHAFNTLTGLPTTMAGYGITDGTKVQVAVFWASGTWTKPAGLSAEAIVQIEIWGGGGGGGSYGGGASVGGGGGGGCCVPRTYRAADLPATVAVTIGGGGGVNAAGGTSTFGPYISAVGGNAGGSSGGGFNQGGAGGTGGTAELAFDMFKGGAGSASGTGAAGGATYYGGAGGGGGTGGSGQPGGPGGWAVFGGGGGGGYDKPGGGSWFGGAGGGNNNGGVASAPGGGGYNGSPGAAGKCLVRVIG